MNLLCVKFPLPLVFGLAGGLAFAAVEPGPPAADPIAPDYATEPMKDWEQKFAEFQFRLLRADGRALPYRFYQPRRVDSGKKYPLVLILHGAGERGRDNRVSLLRFRPTPFWEKYPCFIVAPQCPGHDAEGDQKWVDTRFGAPAHTMKKDPTWELRLAMELLKKTVAENPIDPARIYVTGLSMGGFATWEIIQRLPDTFAAAIPVCGGADLASAPGLARFPLWVFHGAKDTTVLPSRSRDMVAALQAAGGTPKYTEFPDLAHDAWDRAYGDPATWDWLFSQRKP